MSKKYLLFEFDMIYLYQDVGPLAAVAFREDSNIFIMLSLRVAEP